MLESLTAMFAPPAAAEPPLLFGLTDTELALVWVAQIVLLLVGGALFGMPGTTTKLLADFDASHTKAGRVAGAHPAWWWPVCETWCRLVEWGNRTLTYDLGSPMLPAWWGIDFCKGATAPLLFGLMYASDNWSLGAYTYLALHGSYGVLWVVKSWLFGDPRWDKKLPPLGFLIMNTWLFMYWVGGVVLITRGTPVSTERAALATAMYVFGVTAMLGADGQRHFTLRLKPGLISDGWYARTRNPNYLGEILLYASFGVLAQLRLLWAHLLVTWLVVFLPNMWWKEHSFRRKPGWEAYAARSGMLLPKLWPGAPPPPAPAAKGRARSPKRRS